jgi:insulysin
VKASDFPSLNLIDIFDKPQSDLRLYQAATLPNGLVAVAVQDKAATQSAFSVSVTAGQFDDPEDLPGLAHFCEHMLFLGTKKYPDATGFDEFMSRNGGTNNAYTASEITNYFFAVSAGAAKETLERVADFFRAPLFNDDFVEKEVNAIQSEHDKNTQNPQSRIYNVISSMANPKSPVSRFHTGNKDTLFNWPRGNGTTAVAQLRTYFDDHYCAARMHVVSLGRSH